MPEVADSVGTVESDSELQELLRKAVCNVSIPVSQRHLLEGVGPTSASYEGDERRSGRVRVRRWGVIKYRMSILTIQRSSHDCHAVLILNVSRSGIGFLHSEQLFPGEKFRIAMDDSLDRECEIACCRRLADRCYIVGAMLQRNE